MSIEQAATKSGMSVNTAKKYVLSGADPSEIKVQRQTKPNCHTFTEVWDEVIAILKNSPTVMAKTILKMLMREHPDQFQAHQVRSLQRQIKKWRLEHGEDKDVMFPQHIHPGRQSQSDYTVMNELSITIGGQHHKHILFHFMLPYSRWEDVMICYSESFETLTKGYEQAVQKLGGVLPEHRTDNLSAATKRYGSRRAFTDNWKQFLAHYQVKPSRNNPGKSNENGSIEKSNDLLKKAVDQELIMRGNRNFTSLEDYQLFLNKLMLERNQTRLTRTTVEDEYLQYLPNRKWYAPRVSLVTVTPSSTINIDSVIYSVPSRLIAQTFTVHIFADQIKLLFTNKCIHTLQKYSSGPVIDYRHLIGSLLKKPSAFFNYQYQDALFPGGLFRLAYDRLIEHDHNRGHVDYLKILNYAKLYGESEVKVALEIMMEEPGSVSPKILKTLLHLPKALPLVTINQPKIADYNQLLSGMQGDVK